MATLTPKDDQLLWRTSVAMAVENSLRRMGKYEFKRILEILKTNYDVSLLDCYEQPAILKKALDDTFGNAYQDIVSSIEENLNGLVLIDPVRNFLATMKNSD